MRAPPAVREIATIPGKYRFDMPLYYFFFEVAEDGVIYQLTPELQRDGKLRADRWTKHALYGTVTRT